ncbi:MAG: dienelactone hydrolase family protein [Ilyomonas sp.]
MKNLVTVVAAALLSCSLLSCSKELETTPLPVEETAVSLEDSSNLKSNAQIKNLEALHINVVQNIGGYLLYKPEGYSNTNENYPLLVSLAGIECLGNGTSDLYEIARNSVPGLIQKGTFPKSFTTQSGTFSFLVVAPQFKKNPAASDVNAMINYAVKNYRIDTSRIYVMGLSLGGGATAAFAAAYPTKAAAVVTMAEAGGSKNVANAKNIASDGSLPIWAFHNQYDPVVSSSNTVNLINTIQSIAPAATTKMTIFKGVAEHDCWAKATNPNYREDNMNIYEWMLQYTRTPVVERGREVNVGITDVKVHPR